MEKRKPGDIAVDFGKYLTNINSQLNENGQLNYYFTGSLAALLMSKMNSFEELTLNSDSRMDISKENVILSEDTRKRFSRFSRKITKDIDVVNVKGQIWNGQRDADKGKTPPVHRHIIKSIPDFDDLVVNPFCFSGLMYIDTVGEEENSAGQMILPVGDRIAKIKTNNGDFFVSAPPEWLGFKLRETIKLKSSDFPLDNNKYEKNIDDISKFLHAITPLYNMDDLVSRIYTVLSHSPYRCSSERLAGAIREIADKCASHSQSLFNTTEDIAVEELFSGVLQQASPRSVEYLLKKIGPVTVLKIDSAFDHLNGGLEKPDTEKSHADS